MRWKDETAHCDRRSDAAQCSGGSLIGFRRAPVRFADSQLARAYRRAPLLAPGAASHAACAPGLERRNCFTILLT